MKTIIFDINRATAVENAVCKVFNCRISEIVSLKDTLVKKVVVFVLSKDDDFDKRVIGYQYQITYLFVPTVIEELERMCINDMFFRDKIESVFSALNLTAC